MKLIVLAFALVPLALSAAACGKTGDAAGGTAGEAAVNLADSGPRGDPARGEVVYKRACVACHQADGRGMNGALAANFVDDKTRLARPDSELLHSIAEGKKGKLAAMPAQKATLSEQERKDALAYVRVTFGKQEL